MKRGIAAKQLKDILKDVDDDVIFVLPDHDHSYVSANFSSVTKAIVEDHYMGEYYGEELRPSESLIDVIVVS